MLSKKQKSEHAYWLNPEHKARKNARRRERRATDPLFRKRELFRESMKRQEKRETSAEYRAKQREADRIKKARPEYRKRNVARWKERYATDPEFRARHLEHMRNYRAWKRVLKTTRSNP